MNEHEQVTPSGLPLARALAEASTNSGMMGGTKAVEMTRALILWQPKGRPQ